MPPIRRMGINTAISETLIDNTVSDFAGSLHRGFERRIPCFQIPCDVFDHDDGVIHTKAVQMARAISDKLSIL